MPHPGPKGRCSVNIPQLILSIVDVAAAIFLIAVVLLQSGKSAGLSGAIAGVADTFMAKNRANNTLYSGVAAGAGFTAITVAWLAQLNPFAMVGISALLAILQKGADTLNTQMGVPASLSDVITGVLLFFMLGCEFFINYKLVFRGAEERHKRKEAAK